MNSKAAKFDGAFIERKREQLVKLREELSSAKQIRELDEADINAHSAGEAQEYEDDAQRLAMLELEGNLVARDTQRLARIERALKKIEEGTYGFSDESGEPIPTERLEAMPDAICTLAEQEARESIGRPRGDVSGKG